ncbi:type II secretion system F family protein [Mesobacillus harenae]|uniref:type II secretion system F family protein n=1 Tax=Mesobacillus harenae TaxID=2213203 RepID=UPI00157FE6C9|nr:type II secretion system F family protein [Mesobacillus harenae]
MARFKYSGRDRRGKTSGKIVAGSKREAMEKLRADGIRTTEIVEIQESVYTKEITLGNPVKFQHLVIYLRQFATLIKAGVTIVDSTKILAAQTESKPLRKALLDIEHELRDGNPLSDAAEKHPKIFSPMFINMIRAGEASGNMDETLERLADHFEKQHNTRQKIISALSYPAVIGVIAIGVVIFLLVSVVPTFVQMFEDFGGELPAITQFVLNSSQFMQSFWWLIILLGIGLMLAITAVKKNKKANYYLDVFILKVPIFGKLLQKAALARMTRTLSSLVASSVPILNALTIVGKVVENDVISKVILESRSSLEKGQSMTDPMKGHWAFPPLVVQMISIGEETGSLDSMLGKVADFYEKEVENGTDQIKALIEPLMIVFLAGVVGVIVTSIMVPMFEIFNHVG